MNKMDIDGDLIRHLAELMNETGLTEIEVAHGEKQIRVAKQVGMAMPTYGGPAMATAPVAEASGKPGAPAAGSVTAPMVGTAYLAPEPSAPNFVKVGDSVSEGQTLLIIEAMKVMNPIKATKAGTVKQMMVENGQPVEFGEVMLVIE